MKFIDVSTQNCHGRGQSAVARIGWLVCALIIAGASLARAAAPVNAVAWWGAEGNANDSVGSNHGTLQGSATYATGWNGQAFSFAGGTDHVSVPDAAALDFSSSFTIEGWVKVPNLSSYYMVVTKAPSVGPSNYPGNYEVRIAPTTGLVDLGFEHGTSSLTFWQSTVGVAANQWTHIAVVYTAGTSVQFYINGVLSGSHSTSVTPLANNNPLRIGRRADGFAMNGQIDELVLYSRALNATEVAARASASPEIAVLGNGAGINNGDTSPASADGTDFGAAVIGGSPATGTFVITNSGGGTLSLTGSPKVQISGAGAAHFSVVAGSVAGGVSLTNPGFETPVQSAGGFTYGPTGTGIGWTFGGEAGIARNSSPWYVNAAPGGVQAAYIQSNGSDAYFYQNINFPAAGTYVISFDIVRRSATYEGNDVDVRMDGVSIGSVLNTAQTTDTWATHSFTYNCGSAGNHELRFVGTRSGDRDSAIDRVRVDYSSVSVAAGSSTSFQVQFAPQAAGTHTATVTISNDDGDEGTYTFSIQGTGTAPATWTAGSGNGNGAGNGTADGLRVRRNGANIEFSADGGSTWTVNSVYLTTSVLNLTGSSDDDTFVVDFSGGNPVPSGGISITGSGQGTVGDAIVLMGGSHTTVTYGFLNNSDGSINIDGSVINYTGLEPITDNSDAVNRIFDFTGGAETITVTSVSATQTKVDSTLGESVTFNNPTATMTINAGTGNDTVLFYAVSSGWGATVTLNGGAGDDTFQLNKTVATAASITLNGDGHTSADVLNFDREGDNTISASGASPGTVTGGSTAIQTVNYATVETINLHLYGSIGDVVVADRGPYFSTGTILLQKAATGGQQIVTTTIKDPYEIALEADGSFVIADYEVNAGTAGIYRIDRFSGAMTCVSSNGAFEVPFGVKVDNSGGVNNGKYIVADLDADNNGAAEWGAIFVVDPLAASPGNQTMLSSRTVGTGTDFYWLTGLAIGSAGDIYVCDQGNQSSPGTQPPRIFHVDPTTGDRTIIAQGGTLRQPVGLAVVSGTGVTAQLVIVDAGLDKVFRITGTGSVITPSASDELTHTGVTFDKPTHIALDRDGHYIISDAPTGAGAGQRRIHRMNSSTLSTTTISSDGFLEQPRGVIVIP